MLVSLQLAAEEAALGRGGKGLRGADRVAAAKSMTVDRVAVAMEAATLTDAAEGDLFVGPARDATFLYSARACSS